MLDKTLLGYLSILGEVGEDADPGMVSQDANDSGGWSYGLYQFASAPGSVQAFVAWLQTQGISYGAVLADAGDPGSNQGFVETWQQIAANDPAGFGKLQDDYAKSVYYDAGSAELQNKYGFDIGQRSFVLSQVLMSNCVQHGPEYGAEAFGDGAASIGQQLGSMADAAIVTALYNNKINDPSWSSGDPADRQGLFDRWANERDTALALLG